MKSQTNAVWPTDGERAKQIYREAARIFHEKGFDATSMDDLAQALRITKAGLYYYIDSKEDLLFRIMVHGMDWLEVVPGRNPSPTMLVASVQRKA